MPKKKIRMSISRDDDAPPFVVPTCREPFVVTQNPFVPFFRFIAFPTYGRNRVFPVNAI